jgi:pantothenate kinase type III
VFRKGTITPPDAGGPSVNDELFKRLENMMLEQTQSFLTRDNQEIQSKNLLSKSESELSPEEAELLKVREQNADFLAYTSSKVLQMESKSLYNASNPSSGVNTEKRDLESTGIDNSDNPQNKKSK